MRHGSASSGRPRRAAARVARPRPPAGAEPAELRLGRRPRGARLGDRARARRPPVPGRRGDRGPLCPLPTPSRGHGAGGRGGAQPACLLAFRGARFHVFSPPRGLAIGRRAPAEPRYGGRGRLADRRAARAVRRSLGRLGGHAPPARGAAAGVTGGGARGVRRRPRRPAPRLRCSSSPPTRLRSSSCFPPCTSGSGFPRSASRAPPCASPSSASALPGPRSCSSRSGGATGSGSTHRGTCWSSSGSDTWGRSRSRSSWPRAAAAAQLATVAAGRYNPYPPRHERGPGPLRELVRAAVLASRARRQRSLGRTR